MTLEDSLNQVLAQWNPVEVPPIIAEDEYRYYVKDIVLIGDDAERLSQYLKALVSETMGLAYDDSVASHRDDIDNVVRNLIAVLRS